MNKQAVTTIISLSLVCVCAQIAGAEPENKGKRSLAMTPLPLTAAPHMVAHSLTQQKPVSRALLRKKAAAAYPRTHFDKGQYYKNQGDVNAALVEFLKASQENPRLVRAFYEQALIFRQKHYLKLAESSLEQALAVKPDYQDARILLATIRIDQGDVGAAMKELSRSLGIGLPDGSAQQGTTSSAGTAVRQNTKPSPTAPNTVQNSTGADTKMLSVEQLLGRAPAVLQSLHSTLSEIPFFGGNNSPPAKINANANARKPLINPAISGSQPVTADPPPAKAAFSLRPYPPLPPKPAPSPAAPSTRSVHPSPARVSQSPKTTNEIAAKLKTQKNSQAAAISKPEEPPANAAKPTEQSANDHRSDDDVFVLRIPKSFKFFWQHKQPTEDAAKKEQEKGKEVSPSSSEGKAARNSGSRSEGTERRRPGTKPTQRLHTKNSEQPAQQPEQPQKHDQSATADAQNGGAKHEGRSWLFHFFHGTADDTASNGSPEQSSKSEASAPNTQPAGSDHLSHESKKQNADEASTGAIAGTAKQHSARKPKDGDEIKQFVQPPPPTGSDTAGGALTGTGERAVAAKPVKFELTENDEDSADSHKAAFAVPALPSASSQLLSPLNKLAQSEQAEGDQWTKRLRFLEEHGTNSLKEGEAFMFAEDTGEASLFLADGQTIRRKIAPARNEEEVVRERRPDMLIPDELMYNLSLLGKLMPKFGETNESQSASHSDTTASQAPQPNFSVDNLMGDSQGFWGWLKHVFKF